MQAAAFTADNSGAPNAVFEFDETYQRGKCFLCDVDLTSAELKDQHLKGKNHNKKLIRHQVNQSQLRPATPPVALPQVVVPRTVQTPSRPAVTPSRPDVSDDTWCHTCRVPFSGPEPAQQHYSSVKHQQKLMQGDVSRSSLFYCDICEIHTHTQDVLDVHLNSEKHRKKLQSLEQVGTPDLTQWIACDVCPGVKCNSVQDLEKHQTGAAHLRRANLMRAESPVLVPSHSVPVLGGDSPIMREMGLPRPITNQLDVAVGFETEEYEFQPSLGQGYCHACEICLTSPQHRDQHISGKKHMSKTIRWRMSANTESPPMQTPPMQTPVKRPIAAINRSPLQPHQGTTSMPLAAPTYCLEIRPSLSIGASCGPNGNPASNQSSSSQQATIYAPQSTLVRDAVLNYHAAASENRCETCDISCTSAENLEAHYKGKPHLKKQAALALLGLNTLPRNTVDDGWTQTLTHGLQRLSNTNPSFTPSGEVRCDLCNITCSSTDNLKDHYEGKQHLKAKASMMMTEQQQSSPQEAMQGASYTGPSLGGEFRCEDCKIVCSSADNLQAHFQGKQHQKNVDPSRNGTYYCSYCNIYCSSAENLQVHRAGKSHLKIVGNSNKECVNTEARSPSDSESSRGVLYQRVLNSPPQPSNCGRLPGPADCNDRGDTPATSLASFAVTNNGFQSTQNRPPSDGESSNGVLYQRVLNPPPQPSYLRSFPGITDYNNKTHTPAANLVSSATYLMETLEKQKTSDHPDSYMQTVKGLEEVPSADRPSQDVRSEPVVQIFMQNPEASDTEALSNTTEVSPGGVERNVHIVRPGYKGENELSDKSKKKTPLASTTEETTVKESKMDGISSDEKKASTDDGVDRVQELTAIVEALSIDKEAMKDKKPQTKPAAKLVGTAARFQQPRDENHPQPTSSPNQSPGLVVQQSGVDGEIGPGLPPIVKELPCEDSFDLVYTFPRDYQVDVMETVATSDTMVCMRAGMGRSLVSAMATSFMLKNNPRRSVLFLVDTIPMVVKQFEVLRHQISDRMFSRLDESGQLVERSLHIAALADGIGSISDLPLAMQDVVITSPGYFLDLIQDGQVQWDNFCLTVIQFAETCPDEGHPLRDILLHLSQLAYEERPKILSFVVSVLGLNSVDAIHERLEGVCGLVSDCQVVTVDESPRAVTNIFSFTSPEISIITVSEDEKRLEVALLTYLERCYCALHSQLVDANGDLSVVEGLDDLRCEENIAAIWCLLTSEHWRSELRASVNRQLLLHCVVLVEALNLLRCCGLKTALDELEPLSADDSTHSFAMVERDEEIDTQDVKVLIDQLSENVEEESDNASLLAELERLVLSKLDSSEGHSIPSLLLLVNNAKVAGKIADKFESSTEFVAKGIHCFNSWDDESVPLEHCQVVLGSEVNDIRGDVARCEGIIQLNPSVSETTLRQIRGKPCYRNCAVYMLVREEAKKSALEMMFAEENNFIMAAGRMVGSQLSDN